MSAYSDFSQAARQIYERQGQLAADAQRRRGDLIGGTIATLGQIPLVVQNVRIDQQQRAAKAQQQQLENQLKVAEIAQKNQAMEGNPIDNAIKQHKLAVDKINFVSNAFTDATDDTWDYRRAATIAVIPDAEKDIPLHYDPAWVKTQTDLGKTQAQKHEEAIAALKAEEEKNKPKPLHPLETVDAAGKPVTKFVDPTVPAEYPKPTAQLTPDQAADNKRADAQLKIAEAQLTLAQQREYRESQNTNEPLIPVMKDGKAVLVRRSQAEGMTPAATATEKELTQAQTLDAGYARRIDDAEKTLKDVEGNIAKMGLINFTAQSHMPAKAQSAEFQQYDQASRNLINAILRRESGAAISQSEFDNAKRQYLPQPGDAPETLKLKAQNRKRQKEALAAGAGKAYTPEAATGADPLGIR